MDKDIKKSAKAKYICVHVHIAFQNQRGELVIVLDTFICVCKQIRMCQNDLIKLDWIEN